jgi:hypothetical protein
MRRAPLLQIADGEQDIEDNKRAKAMSIFTNGREELNNRAGARYPSSSNPR